MSNGYQVDPQELTAFAGHLKDTTSAAVTKAAAGVHAANGFDNNAFGIFAAQLLAVPARIAMGVVAGNLDGLAKTFSETSDLTEQAAKQYAAHEDDVVQTLQKIDQELGG